MGWTNFPNGVTSFGIPLLGTSLAPIFAGTQYANSKDPNGGNIYFVDGDYGSDANPGHSPSDAKLTIGGVLSVSGPGAVIYVKAKNVAAGGTDPSNYAETFIIGASQFGTKIIGVPSGVAQGAQPQIKKGSGATSMITVRAPGCLIANLTINMAGSTGGGILLDDDGSTKTAFGTVIQNCVFKGNANKSNLAGSVCIGANGGAWQLQIVGNHFVDCCTGINNLGTGQAIIKDITVEDNLFYAFANTDVDADIDFRGGSAGSAIMVRNNVFGTVDVPAKAGGNAARYIAMTACVNSAVVDNVFACIGAGTGAKTFGAAGNAALIPATVRMARNYGEVGTSGDTGEILRT